VHLSTAYAANTGINGDAVVRGMRHKVHSREISRRAIEPRFRAQNQVAKTTKIFRNFAIHGSVDFGTGMIWCNEALPCQTVPCQSTSESKAVMHLRDGA
jgi:hypothetical protein